MSAEVPPCFFITASNDAQPQVLPDVGQTTLTLWTYNNSLTHHAVQVRLGTRRPSDQRLCYCTLWEFTYN